MVARKNYKNMRTDNSGLTVFAECAKLGGPSLIYAVDYLTHTLSSM